MLAYYKAVGRIGNFLTSLPLQSTFGGNFNEFQGKNVRLGMSVSTGVHSNYTQMSYQSLKGSTTKSVAAASSLFLM